jgi:hypothetical protein
VPIRPSLIWLICVKNLAILDAPNILRIANGLMDPDVKLHLDKLKLDHVTLISMKHSVLPTLAAPGSLRTDHFQRHPPTALLHTTKRKNALTSRALTS